jgi:hypothetical protein
MSEFRGFKCEGCGAIVGNEGRVKEKVQFIGPDGEIGSFYRDLCLAECAPQVIENVKTDYTVTPKRAPRRRVSASGPTSA